jgi:hypothetical protein
MHPIVSLETARQALEKHRNGEPWSAAPYIQWIGAGPKFDVERPKSLRDKLEGLRSEFPPDALPRNQAKDFEAHAAPLVHAELDLDPTVAASREFWLWLNFAAADGSFLRIVDWRFGSQTSIGMENYGVVNKAGVWEGLFARLWWRGNLGFEPEGEDPYDIARRGDLDIWRSHIIRQEYGRCRELAVGLIRYQYPDDDPDSRRLTNDVLRELVKRLRMLDATTAYETLSSEQMLAVIQTNVERIRTAVD